jgi:hypothetical protein
MYLQALKLAQPLSIVDKTAIVTIALTGTFLIGYYLIDKCK